MAHIPTYAEWMRDTHASFARRNKKLELVDLLFGQYNKDPTQDRLQALKEAFNGYLSDYRKRKDDLGKDWKNSIRNQRGALTNLNRALNDVDRRMLTPEEREAVAEANALMRDALRKQFEGKKLTLKYLNKRASANDAISATSALFGVGSNAVNLGTGAVRDRSLAATRLLDNLRALVLDVCGGNEAAANAIFDEIGLSSLRGFLVRMTPVVNVLVDLQGTIVSGVVLGLAVKGRAAVVAARPVVARGDPMKAFEALEIIVDREVHAAAISLATAATGFTANTVCQAVGLAAAGPAIAIAQALANLLNVVRQMYRDHTEVERANELLAKGELDFRLFETCPILGCYFLCVQDHSTIISFAVEDYGSEGFALDVERMIARIRPVLEKAASVIRGSRYEIAGFENHKGIALGDFEKLGVVDKLGNLAQHVADSIIEAVCGNRKTPPPRVHSSRIVGYDREAAEKLARIKAELREDGDFIVIDSVHVDPGDDFALVDAPAAAPASGGILFVPTLAQPVRGPAHVPFGPGSPGWDDL